MSIPGETPPHEGDNSAHYGASDNGARQDGPHHRTHDEHGMSTNLNHQNNGQSETQGPNPNGGAHHAGRMPGHDTVSRVARNAGFFFITKSLDAAAMLILTPVIARYLGVRDFGDYSFVIALVLVGVSLSYSGLEILTVREIAKNPANAARSFGNIVRMRWFLVSISVALLGCVTYFINVPEHVKIAILIATVSQVTFSTGNLHVAVFRAFERMEQEIFVTFVFRVAQLGMIIGVALADMGFIAIFVATALANFLRTLIATRMVRKKFIAREAAPFDLEGTKTLMREAIVIGVNLFIMFGIARMDVIILKAFDMTEGAALFNAAYSLIIQLQVVPVIMITAMFPTISRSGGASAETLRTIYRKATKLMVVFALPTMLALYILSDLIIGLLYGADFAASATGLRIMIWGSVFMFIGALFDHLLIALGKPKYITISTAACFGTNIAVDLALIPKYGHIGAAIGTLSGIVALIVFLIFFITKNLGGMSLKDTIAKPLAGIAVMWAIVLIPSPQWLLVPKVIAGGMIYMGVLFAIGAFEPDEIEIMKALLRRRRRRRPPFGGPPPGGPMRPGEMPHGGPKGMGPNGPSEGPEGSPQYEGAAMREERPHSGPPGGPRRRMVKDTYNWFLFNVLGKVVQLMPLGAIRTAGSLWGRASMALFGHRTRVMRRELGDLMTSEATPQMIELWAREAWAIQQTYHLESLIRRGRMERIYDRVFVIDGREHLDAALSRGRGAVMAIAHFGAHHHIMPALSLAGYTVNQIARSPLKERARQSGAEPPASFKGIEKIISQYATFIPVGGGMRPVFECLKRNEVLIAAVDGRVQSRMTTQRLLGLEVDIAVGPFDIARRTRATLLPSFVVLGADGRYTLFIEPEIPVAEDAALDECAGRFVAIFAEYVRKYPGHYAMTLQNERVRKLRESIGGPRP